MVLRRKELLGSTKVLNPGSSGVACVYRDAKAGLSYVALRQRPKRYANKDRGAYDILHPHDLPGTGVYGNANGSGRFRAVPALGVYALAEGATMKTR